MQQRRRGKWHRGRTQRRDINTRRENEARSYVYEASEVHVYPVKNQVFPIAIRPYRFRVTSRCRKLVGRPCVIIRCLRRPIRVRQTIEKRFCGQSTDFPVGSGTSSTCHTVTRDKFPRPSVTSAVPTPNSWPVLLSRDWPQFPSRHIVRNLKSKPAKPITSTVPTPTSCPVLLLRDWPRFPSRHLARKFCVCSRKIFL